MLFSANSHNIIIYIHKQTFLRMKIRDTFLQKVYLRMFLPKNIHLFLLYHIPFCKLFTNMSVCGVHGVYRKVLVLW